MYVISYHETNHNNGRHTGGCTAHLTGMNCSTQIHPVILSWLADNWKKLRLEVTEIPSNATPR
jgi:hypothetical protein